MYKKFAKKTMTFILSLTLSFSVFMGASIESNATSVSGNEPIVQSENLDISNEQLTNNTTVSGNEPVVNENTLVNNGMNSVFTTAELENPIMLTSEESGLIAPTELKWSKPGVMSFVINDLDAIYSIDLQRDGSNILHIELGDFSDYYTVGMTYEMEEYEAFDASGTYRFRIKLSENDDEDVWDFESGYVSEYSEEYAYTLPDKKLPNPSNVRWSSSEAGLVEWDTIENTYGYDTELLDKDGFMEYGLGFYGSSHHNYADYSDKIGENGPYSVRVRAISSDIENVTHSDWTYCDYVDLDGIVNATNSTLSATADKMSAATDAASAQAVVTELQASVADSKNDLKVSMQSNSETRDMIQSLEDSYKSKANIIQTTTVDETLMDPSKISILGSALNATPNANVSFNISKPTEEAKELINTDRYKSVLAFEMGLEGEGINSSDLAIPVCITLPIPEGMKAHNLRILHYSTAGAEPVIYDSSNIRINGDGTFSFTITHFSLFAIVETEESENGGSGESAEVVYSKGSSKKSHSSGAMGWTPTTPDEKKRYALMGKEPVEFVAAAANTYNLTVLNSMQGPKCFDSFEAVLGDFTIGRTYSIYPVKNKVCSMEQAAKLTLTIPKALRADGRLFKMICVTEDGTPYILNDLDKDPNTITFETDKFYAFALIYK